MMKWTALAMMIGFLADLIFGDPRWLYHPVRLIGKEISFFGKKAKSHFPKTQKGEFQAGIWMAVIICIFLDSYPSGTGLAGIQDTSGFWNSSGKFPLLPDAGYTVFEG